MSKPRRCQPLPPPTISEAAKFAGMRTAALGCLNGGDRRVEFDGVIIDLNHPDLDPQSWVLQGEFGTSNYSGPILWFPSDPEPPITHYSLIALRLGDSVRVADVTPETVGFGLDGQPDLARRIAKLQVIRPNEGTPIPLRGRLAFRSPSTLLVGSASGRQTGGVTVSRIAARVAMLVGAAAQSGATHGGSDDFAGAASQALERQAELALDGDVHAASDAAAEAGYFLARAEAQAHPVVGRGFKAVRQQLDASIEGGRMVARGKSEVWIPLAKNIWAKSPNDTINKVANLIAEKTGADPRSISRAIKPHKPNARQSGGLS